MFQARPELSITETTVEKFETRWRRKIMFARLNGVIQHHYTKVMEKRENVLKEELHYGMKFT